VGPKTAPTSKEKKLQDTSIKYLELCFWLTR